VIVTYEPDVGFVERVHAIRRQVPAVFIVDNRSSAAALEMLRGLARSDGVRLLELGENGGIGVGLNRGFAAARDAGFAWALTFDQDSVPKPGMFEALVELYRTYPHRDQVAILSANYEERATGSTGTPRGLETTAPWLEVDEVITSGCLQSLAVFDAVGPYREDFFMYFVDNEYCLRVRRAGYRVLLSTTPWLLHETGRATSHRLGTRDVVTWNYAPWRHYYIVRNGILTVREFSRTDPEWAFRRGKGLVKRSLTALLFEADRRAKLIYMARGVYDAFLGRTGRLEP
jgi:rhamnosyltransferase